MPSHAFLCAAPPLFGPGSCYNPSGSGVEALFLDSVGPAGIYGLEVDTSGEVQMRAHGAPGDVHFADFVIFGSGFEVSAANPLEVVACLLRHYWMYPAHGTQYPKPIVSFRARSQEPQFQMGPVEFNPSTDYAIDPLAFSLTGNVQGNVPIPSHQMFLQRQSVEEIQKEAAARTYAGVPYTWMLNGQMLPLSNILIRLCLNQPWSGSLWEPLGDRFTPQGWRHANWVDLVHPNAQPLVEDPEELARFKHHNAF